MKKSTAQAGLRPTSGSAQRAAATKEPGVLEEGAKELQKHNGTEVLKCITDTTGKKRLDHSVVKECKEVGEKRDSRPRATSIKPTDDKAARKIENGKLIVRDGR